MKNLLKQKFSFQRTSYFSTLGGGGSEAPSSNIGNTPVRSFIKDIFNSPMPNDQQKMAEGDQQNQEYSYYQLAKQLENLSANNKVLQKHMAEIYNEIKATIDQSYQNKNIQYVLTLVPSKTLCHFAVEQFIGSITSPRNENIMTMFLNQAEKNALTDFEKREVRYYKLYLKKLSAIQSGDKQAFESTNEELLQLCEQDCPQAMHIVGKELYKVALNIVSHKQKRDKREMIKKAAELFDKASQQGSKYSFYYLGELAEHGDLPGGTDLKYAYECYLISATSDSPQAYFKLAKFHKEGIVVEKDPKLQVFYTKMAAELGLAEAQHNLGCMYMEKILVPYNGVKAMAWLTQAAASGFAHSMYNVAKLFMEGSEDGKVKVNYQAALVWLEKLQKTDQIDVDHLIKKVVQGIEKEDNTLQESKKEGDNKAEKKSEEKPIKQ